MKTEAAAKAAALARDRALSLAAVRTACVRLQEELAREEDELSAVDEEFHESPSYRMGSMLCPRSRS